MNNYFAYMRISTKEERQMQRFARQENSIEKYAKENNIEYIYIAKEDESGKSFDNRKEWNKVERLLQEGDTVVFKDISRFTRETENGYKKYNELMQRGIELIFIDNPTVSTPYIKNLLNIAEQQNIVAKTTLESTVKLLLIVELDRVEQERIIFIKRVRDGIKASPKKSGRKTGTLDKMSDALKEDIFAYLNDRSIKQVDLVKKHNISRNTLKKYVQNYEKSLYSDTESK